MALAPISAQTNIETNAPGVQLNFSVPGARSLALGGTFLGRADDATAAYANPAGLAHLPQQEASLELRAWEYTHVFTNEGRSGEPSGIGADNIRGLVDGEATDEVSGLSFASFVYPSRRWAVAVYSHALADFKANFETRGAFAGDFTDGIVRLFPIVGSSRLKISNNGVSASYRVSEKLSLGVGLSRYDFEVDTTLLRFDFQEIENNDPYRAIYGQLGVDATELFNTQTQTGTDSDIGATLGLLWRISPRWQLGGVYRQGPSFTFQTTHQREQLFPGERQLPSEVRNEGARFHVPDVWGVGAMWQATDRLILGLDFYRVGYSVFAEDFTNVFRSDSTGPTDDYSAEDGDELHAGLEYLFPNGRRPWFVRSGLWWDPEHGVRYVGDTRGALGRQEEIRFRERDGVLHWAAGVGVVGNSYQLDAGVDYSQRTLTVSVSTVVRF